VGWVRRASVNVPVSPNPTSTVERCMGRRCARAERGSAGDGAVGEGCNGGFVHGVEWDARPSRIGVMRWRMFAGRRSLVCAGSIHSCVGESQSMFVWCKTWRSRGCQGAQTGAMLYKPLRPWSSCGCLHASPWSCSVLASCHFTAFVYLCPRLSSWFFRCSGFLRELRQVRWPAN
jgi:hypothetical protein